MSNSGIDKIKKMQGRPLRLILVCPKFPCSYYSFDYFASLIGKTAVMPPLGLLTIAAMCPPDWIVKIVDEGVENLTDDNIQWADIVGVTSMIVQYSAAVKIARRAGSFGKPTIIGGPHVTSEPEVYANEFDVLIRNEGEITFNRFVDDYCKSSVVALYQTELKANLAETPIPLYDLLQKANQYISFGLQFSRGCPYECEFCDVTMMFGHKMRVKPINTFLKELDSILASSFKRHFLSTQSLIFIVDDNFAAPRRHTSELCDAIVEWNRINNHPFYYFTQTSIDIAKNDNLLSKLEAAGFNGVFIGLETPSKESLAHTSKRQNLGVDVEEAVKKIQSYGLRVDSGIIVGFDTDMEDIFERQVEFVEKIGVSIASVGILTALPSSLLYKRMRQEGRLLMEHTPLNLYSLSENFNISGLINIQPKHFSLKALLEGYSLLISKIYDPKNYFRRVLKQVSRLKSRPLKFSKRIKIIFVIFPMLSFKIISRYHFRFQYLRATIQLVFRFPIHLREFLILTTFGIHYMEFTRLDLVPWARREIDRLAGKEKHKVFSEKPYESSKTKEWETI